MRLQIIRDFLLKENYDFDRPDIDLYNFHPQLRIFLAVNGVFFSNRNSRVRFIWPSICIQLSVAAMTLEEIFIWRGVSTRDYSLATECFCYWVILGCIPTVYCSIVVKTDKIRDIVVKMNEDFIFVCSLGPRYRKPFLEGQILIWQLCFVWFIFVSFVGGLYVVFPVVGLVYQSLFATVDENTVRPLQFPMWLPNDDPYRTPNYEMFLVMQMSLCFIFVQTFCVYIYTLFHILLHYYAIMDMIIIDFSVIFEGLDKSVALLPRNDERRMKTQLILNARIRKIVTWHLSVFRKPFLEGQILIWQLCFVWFIFVSFVGGLYVVFPVVGLVYQSLFATVDENTVRPLQFPMWLPNDDPYRTPNYEMFLVMQMSLCFIFVQTFCVYIYTLFHILLHYYAIMDMIIIDFSVIFEGLDKSVALLPRNDERRMKTQLILNARIRKIVTWHLSVFSAVSTVSSVYGLPLVYQVSFSSIAICLIAYQIAEKIDNGTVDILFCLLGIAACLQLWIPCHLGTMIRNKAFEVGDAGWTCGWHETPLGLMIRSDIIIIILRAQQPVTIKFTGLPQVQLETFSSCMSSSYSYFNMLRQYSK